MFKSSGCKMPEKISKENTKKKFQDNKVKELVEGVGLRCCTRLIRCVSCRVHGPGADIDTLCVGPSYVNREEDFFIILHEILAEKEDVTELQPVPDAHVPVMKFKFRGIFIDLLYASVSLLVVPQEGSSTPPKRDAANEREKKCLTLHLWRWSYKQQGDGGF